jgi:PPK2 family polyphosphate:nucleotide phosphotransferase
MKQRSGARRGTWETSAGYAQRVAPGSRVELTAVDAGYTAGLRKAEGEARSDALEAELGELQELLYAAGQHAALLILQGVDTSGKDGTIKSVLRGINPAGCRVTGFKVPTETELKHDFLWRVHAATPERGQLGVFNRSHYEDVLAVRVHELVPPSVWRGRYEHINAFERLLTDNTTIVVKCYLHISKEEQEERLLARERDVTKAWKLSARDWIERRSWEEYIAAYEDALARCSTDYAPWFIIPADKKWFRNLAVAQTLVDALRPHKEGWLAHLQEVGRRALAEIEAVRRGREQEAARRAGGSAAG